MTQNASESPKRGRPAVGAKYPRQLPIMLSARDYDAIGTTAEIDETSKGDVARRWMKLGRDLEEALAAHEGLADRVEALRAEAATSNAAAIGRLLDFATLEARRRQKRDGELARMLVRRFAEDGVAIDGVDVGSVSIEIEG